MVDRLKNVFEELKKKNEAAFIPFFVAGDPSPDLFIDIIENIEPHVDVIELGIQFTDPVADGPVIQNANKRAMESGTFLPQTIELITRIRKFTNKPIVLLTYANVIGVGSRKLTTLQKFSEIGVDGIIIADVPIEESSNYSQLFKNLNLHQIFLSTPNTKGIRLNKIIAKSSGFLYVVAVRGITGARESILEETKETINRISNQLTQEDKKIPLCIGFGISKPKHVKELFQLGADGVIVGSAIIRIIEANLSNPDQLIDELAHYIKEMKAATRKYE